MDMIHSGSTLLNLGLTGTLEEGWPLGRISNIVGDRSSGKTLLAIEAMTSMLERPPKGVTPNVSYLETESAFDRKYASALGLPVDKVNFLECDTVEDFYSVLCGIINKSAKKDATLVIVDSLDGLSDSADAKKVFGAQDYDRKAQKLSELFRKSVRGIEDKKIHLMFISQIRENISKIPFAPKWRRSGGKALDFYASHICWLRECSKITSGKKKLVTGIEVEVKITKNKVSKPFRDVQFPIRFGYGIDNIYSLIKFLGDDDFPKGVGIEKKKAGYYDYEGQSMQVNDFIKYLEENPKKFLDIKKQVKGAWDWAENNADTVRANKSSFY